MPMGEYETFEQCERTNQDKDNPAAYCGEIKKRTEDVIAPECVVKTFNTFSEKYPDWSKRDVLAESFRFLKERDLNNDFMEVDFTQPQTLDLILKGIALQYDTKNNKEDGRWVTLHGGSDDPDEAGTHVFIPKGKSVKSVIEKKFGKKEPKKKEEPEKRETEKKSRWQEMEEGRRARATTWTKKKDLGMSTTELSKEREAYYTREYHKAGRLSSAARKKKRQTLENQRGREIKKQQKEKELEIKRKAKEEEAKKKPEKKPKKEPKPKTKKVPKKEPTPKKEPKKPPKKEPEFTEREKKIRKIIEKTGFEKEQAEEHLKKKEGKKKDGEPKPKKEPKPEKKIEKKPSEQITKKKEKEIPKKKEIKGKKEKSRSKFSKALERRIIAEIRKKAAEKDEDKDLMERIYPKIEISELDEDFTEDQLPESKIPEGTRLQEKVKLLAEYERAYGTKEAQRLRAELGEGVFTPTIESISVPFRVRNSETGAVVKGSVVSRLDKNTKQLRPVSSSNVRGVGQFGNELLVQFHGDKTARRTYRYNFGDPQTAEAAYNSLTESGSPGRWIWQNIRGHTKGEPTGVKKVPHKYGPSLSPPGRGKPTLGGTSSSLVNYSISNRVPVSRVEHFEAMTKQMKRSTPNPTKNPQTGSELEGRLQRRKDSRKVGELELAKKTRRQFAQLPKLDFTVDSFDDLIKWVQEHIASNREAAEEIALKILKKKKTEKTGTKAWQKQWGWLGKHFEELKLKKEDITREDVKRAFFKKAKETHPDRKGGTAKKFIKTKQSHDKLIQELKHKGKIDFSLYNLEDFEITGEKLDFDTITFDSIDLTQFTNISKDFNAQDFSILHGPITRAGPFPYERNGRMKIYYKEWDNLKNVFGKLDYIPLIGSKREGSHRAETIGFAYNFENDEKNRRILADIITLEDINILSDNYKPEKEGWEVSIGFKDLKTGTRQILYGVDHLAMSLRNTEMGRCRAGGDPCYGKLKEPIHDQNLKMEVIS